MKRFFKFVISFFAMLLLVSPFSTVKASENEAMSVLLLGTDTGDLGRSDEGRSDVLMVATINPKSGRATLTSIPRDTYVDIPGYGMDKINHAYAFGGPELSQEAVNNLLDIKLDHYIVVNMAGIQEIVDAVDGVEVVPPVSFSIGDYSFTEGETTHLDGAAALEYARERYTSGGDYARQERQRDIVMAIIEKVSTMNLKDAKALGKLSLSLKDNIDMSMDLNELVDFGRSLEGQINSVESYQLWGTGSMIDGVYYEIPDESSLQETKDRIHSELES